MEWMLARDWFHSASKLDAVDARHVLIFQKKLYDDPDCTSRGLNFEALRGVRDRRVKSLRVDGSIRAIVWHDGPLGVLLYVDQHEPAYDWAEGVRVNVTTLANCVAVAVTMDADGDADSQQQWSGMRGVSCDEEPGLFGCFSTTELLDAGVPEILLPTVRSIRDDAALDELSPALEADLCDRLVALYLGEDGADAVRRKKAEMASVASAPEPASESEASPEPAGYLDTSCADPDLPPGSTQALPLRDVDPDDFQRMLENPTEWWVAFADPVQRKIAEGTFSGAVLVSGGAGTGKTIVAMHRARHLARKGKRVLITSYNVALCEAINRDIRLLCDESDLERITAKNIDDVALELCPDDQMAMEMPAEDLYTRRIHRAVQALSPKGAKSPYDAVIVDETQDLDGQRLALVRALAGKGRNSLTLLGDMNQRIYGEPLDLEDLHISVEGRTFTLAAGYRTTREIAEFGQRILADQDGDAADIPRSLDAPASGVPGPRPIIAEFSSLCEEAVAVAMAILEKLRCDVQPERIAVFARRRKRLRGVERALNALGVTCMDLDLGREAPRVGVRLMTMHQARGLEFRTVFVVGASDAELPDPKAVELAETDAKRRSVLQIERSLLYVSATRATHELQVSWVGHRTEYLETCHEAAEPASGFDVAQHLGVELDTATLEDDLADFRIAGQDYVAGGRQIAQVLSEHLDGHEEEWTPHCLSRDLQGCRRRRDFDGPAHGTRARAN